MTQRGAARRVQVVTNAFAAGTTGGGSNFYFQEFTHLGNRIAANLRGFFQPKCTEIRLMTHQGLWWSLLFLQSC